MWFWTFFKKRKEEKKREAIEKATANMMEAQREGHVGAMIFFAQELKKLKQS